MSAWEIVANEAACDEMITWAIDSPMVNMRSRIHHRSVSNPISDIDPAEHATPTRPDATRRRGPIRG